MTFLDSTTFAFLDLETTGGSTAYDRITEIGIRFWRDGQVVDEWQTLLNPRIPIPPFIERYTGISNAMVADAPVFEDIADESCSNKATPWHCTKGVFAQPLGQLYCCG